MFEIIKLISNQEDKKEGRAIALGNFDGIHLGHQAILEAIKEKNNLIPCAITFREPPIKWFKPNEKIELITVLEERLELFKLFGMQEVIIFDFGSIQNLKAIDYLKLLQEKLNCEFIASGLNHHFGKNKEGNYKLLNSFEGISSNSIDYFIDDQTGQIISSSLIRSTIKQKSIQEVNKLLGHNFFIMGQLIEGLQIGTQLGFPTLNLNYPPEKVKPQFGVYSALTHFDNRIYKSAINFGFSPTLKQVKEPLLESHLLEMPLNLPKRGDNLKIELIEFIRPEHKFGSFEDLQKQIKIDCEKILNSLSSKYC